MASYSLDDIAVALHKVTSAAGITLSETDISNLANRVETYLYVFPAKNDPVAAFKEAATAESVAGDIDKMSKELPNQLNSARNARLQAAKDEADKARAEAEAGNAKKNVAAQISAIATAVNGRIDDVNKILDDVQHKLPTIKSAATTADINDIDDKLDTQLTIIETAATDLLDCQATVAKTKALKTAQTAEKKSLTHFQAAQAAQIAINGIETRIGSNVEAAKAADEKKKASAKKAKKEKAGKFDRFRSSWKGHLTFVAVFVIAMAVLFLAYLPYWFQVGAVVVAVVVLGYYLAMALTDHVRRGQNVVGIATIVVLGVLAILFLVSASAGTGVNGDNTDFLGRPTEVPTPVPTQHVEIEITVNNPAPETPVPTATSEP